MDIPQTHNLENRAWVLHDGGHTTNNSHHPAAGIDESPSPILHPAPPPAKQPAKPKKSSVWRMARASLALVVLTALLWWLVLPLIFPVTSRAIINARTVQIRAPGDGTNADLRHDISDEVEGGQTLFRVTNPRVDTSHLAELKGKLSKVEAEQARGDRDLAAGVAELPELVAIVKRFQQVALDGLASSVKVAKAKTESARIEIDAAEQRLKRLSRPNAATNLEYDTLQDNVARASKNLEKEEAGLARVSVEYEGAKKGVFLTNEASYAKKRADEVEQKNTTLRSTLKENAELRAAAYTQIREEEQRLAHWTGIDVTSPVSGTVWRRHGNVGQVVKQNELVYEVADRETIFVEALFHQRYLSSAVAPGAKAIINLTSGQRLCGRVKAIRTLGEADTEACYAVNLAGSDVKHVRVLIALDANDRDAALIGRHVRVLIVSEEPGYFARGVAWMFSKVGG